MARVSITAVNENGDAINQDLLRVSIGNSAAWTRYYPVEDTLFLPEKEMSVSVLAHGFAPSQPFVVDLRDEKQRNIIIKFSKGTYLPLQGNLDVAAIWILARDVEHTKATTSLSRYVVVPGELSYERVFWIDTRHQAPALCGPKARVEDVLARSKGASYVYSLLGYHEPEPKAVSLDVTRLASAFSKLRLQVQVINGSNFAPLPMKGARTFVRLNAPQMNSIDFLINPRFRYKLIGRMIAYRDDRDVSIVFDGNDAQELEGRLLRATGL